VSKVFYEKNWGVAGVSPAEGVAENAAGGWSEGETSPLLASLSRSPSYVKHPLLACC